jgi:hypothetical protein
MASLVLSGDTSGSITVSAPAVAGSTTQTLVNVTGTLAPIVSGTAQTAPPPTPQYFDFTSIPSWVKRVTVMFSGVSTSGTSNPLIQIGSGSVTTTGYVATSMIGTTGVSNTAYTTGFGVATALASNVLNGAITLYLLGSNTYVASGAVASSTNLVTGSVNGTVTLSGTLDRLRITTVNGTDTFDAGSINILYE